MERRGSTLEDGLGLLTATVAELGDTDLDDLCDRVLQRMAPPQPDDDIALVAIQLHPQGQQPRPPEAGPERVPGSVPDPTGSR